MDVEIGKPRGPEDWAAVRDICCETGDAGRAIAPERRPFFAEFWIGPYQKLLPDWTFVARAEGRVVGYLTGCPDTVRFTARSWLLHRIPLTVDVLRGRYRMNRDWRWYFNPAHGAARRLAVRGPKLYWRLGLRYPAHLHVNVREGWRSAGTGARLVDAYVGALRAAGVRGLHLFCGPKPVAFYRRNGFHVLGAYDFGRGPVFAMGRRIR